MAENIKQKDEKKEKKKFIIIIIIGIIIIILLTLALIFVIMKENQEKENYNPPNPAEEHIKDGKLQYDSAAIILDQDELQQAFNELYEKVEDGYISLTHKNQAFSSDGRTFSCYIQNNIDNNYDFYINIYKDQSAQEQLYLSGLIPPGSGIDHFDSQIKLDPGTYDALLVITQVEDDHETIRDGQLFLALHLTVS
ncbi:MAG: hypothetical protein NC203_08485 [Firmicutes bacterium]|nr:hypothetical protein [[Eubacterium] siraeum]MCM1488388.1 hypothetical protein [Bacillota bacterium]